MHSLTSRCFKSLCEWSLCDFNGQQRHWAPTGTGSCLRSWWIPSHQTPMGTLSETCCLQMSQKQRGPTSCPASHRLARRRAGIQTQASAGASDHRLTCPLHSPTSAGWDRKLLSGAGRWPYNLTKVWKQDRDYRTNSINVKNKFVDIMNTWAWFSNHMLEILKAYILNRGMLLWKWKKKT